MAFIITAMFATRNYMLNTAPSLRAEAPQETAQASADQSDAVIQTQDEPPVEPAPAENFERDILIYLKEMPPGPAREKAVVDLFKRWAYLDERAALTWAEGVLEGGERLAALREGLSLWAARDVQQAAQWAQGMAQDRSQALAVEALMDVWGAYAPQEAAAWLSEQPANAGSDAAARTLARRWADTDLNGALAWVRTQIDQGPLTPGGIAVIRGVAEQNPQAMMTLAIELPQSDTRAQALGVAFELWSEHEPAKAARFLQSNEQAYMRELSETLAEKWGMSDAAAASQWVAGLPEGSARDNATQGLARALMPYDIRTAVVWAQSISDESQRVNASKALMQYWLNDDPATAAEFIREQGAAFLSETPPPGESPEEPDTE